MVFHSDETLFGIFFCAQNGSIKINCIFSLGHFQWCICKYEDGPCLDFSGGTFTVCLPCSFFFFLCVMIIRICIVAKFLGWSSHVNHAYSKWVSKNIIYCSLFYHMLFLQIVYTALNKACCRDSWLHKRKRVIDQSMVCLAEKWVSELIFLNM